MVEGAADTPKQGAPRGEPAFGWIIASYVAAVVVGLAGVLIGAGVLRPRESRHWIPVTVLGALNILLNVALLAAR